MVEICFCWWVDGMLFSNIWECCFFVSYLLFMLVTVLLPKFYTFWEMCWVSSAWICPRLIHFLIFILRCSFLVLFWTFRICSDLSGAFAIMGVRLRCCGRLLGIFWGECFSVRICVLVIIFCFWGEGRTFIIGIKSYKLFILGHQPSTSLFFSFLLLWWVG